MKNYYGIKNSQEAKEIKKYVQEELQKAEREVRDVIFTELPKLHLDIVECLEKDELFQIQSVPNACKILLDKYTCIEQCSPPNQDVLRLHRQIEKFLGDFTGIASKILFWVQIMLPKQQSSGTDASQEALLTIAGIIQKMQENSDHFDEVFIKYYSSRAVLIKKMIKHKMDDYYQCLMAMEMKQFMNGREILSNLSINVLNLYRIINDNFERIRDRNIHHKTVHAMYY